MTTYDSTRFEIAKKDSLKVSIIFIIMIIVTLMIGYCAGYIDSNNANKGDVELFNTFYENNK